MSIKVALHSTNKYVSNIIYICLLISVLTFYTSVMGVLDAIIDQNYALTWYNSSHSLIISLIAWFILTLTVEYRLTKNPAILVTNKVRKFVLTTAASIFLLMTIYGIYQFLSQYMNNTHDGKYYLIQCLKIALSLLTSIYFYLASKREPNSNMLFFKVIGVVLFLSGIVLVIVNLNSIAL